MRSIVMGAVVAMAGLAAPGAAAQAGPPLQPGEIIENGGGGQQIKVLQCFPTPYRWRECDTVGWQNGKAVSNVARWNEEDLIKGDARVRAATGMRPRGGVRAATAPAARPAARPAPPVAARPPAAGGRIPNGTYKCQMWMGGSYVSLGTVRSVNGSLETGLLNKVGATFTGATPNADGVTINYKTARGYNESMDCKRQ
jgi:hypothetical protein